MARLLALTAQRPLLVMSDKYTRTIRLISLESAECELHPLAEWSLIPSSLQGPLTLTTSQTWSRLRTCVWADGRRPMISLADERRWVRHPPRKPRRRRPPPAARCSQWEGDVVPAIAPRTLTATARGGGGTDPPPPPPPLATRHSPVLPPPPLSSTATAAPTTSGGGTGGAARDPLYQSGRHRRTHERPVPRVCAFASNSSGPPAAPQRTTCWCTPTRSARFRHAQGADASP